MERKACAGSGLSLLYVGLRLGFLFGGVVVRRTGAFRPAVVVSAARASVRYAMLASSVIGMSDPPFQNLDTTNSILDLTTMSGQFILLAVGGSIAAPFGGLIVSLDIHTRSVRNVQEFAGMTNHLPI